MIRRNTITAFHDSWPICPYYYTFNNGSYDDIFLHRHDMQLQRQQRKHLALLKRRRVRKQLSSSSSHLRLPNRKRTSRVIPQHQKGHSDEQQQQLTINRRFTFPTEEIFDGPSSACSTKEQVANNGDSSCERAGSFHDNLTQMSTLPAQQADDQSTVSQSVYNSRQRRYVSRKSKREKRQTLANVIACLSRPISTDTTNDSDDKVSWNSADNSNNANSGNVHKTQSMSAKELQLKWNRIGQYNSLLDNEKTLEQLSDPYSSRQIRTENLSTDNRASSLSQFLAMYAHSSSANNDSLTHRDTVYFAPNASHKLDDLLQVVSSPTATDTATTTLHENGSRVSYPSSTRHISDFTAITSNDDGQYDNNNNWKGKARYSQALEKDQRYQFHNRSSSHHQAALGSDSDENPNDILMLPTSDASTNNTSNVHFQSSLSSAASASSSPESQPSSLPPRISNEPQRMRSMASLPPSLTNSQTMTIKPTIPTTRQSTTPSERSGTGAANAAATLPNHPNFLHLEEAATFIPFNQKRTRTDMLLLLFGFLFFPLWWYGSWRYFMHDDHSEKATAKHVQLINCFMSLLSLLLVGLTVGLVTVWA